MEAGINSDAEDVKPLEYLVGSSSNGNFVELPIEAPIGKLSLI